MLRCFTRARGRETSRPPGSEGPRRLLLALALLACSEGSDAPADDASPGVPSAGASSTGAGGASSAGADGASSAGSPAAGGALLSEAEWQALTAPPAGEHEIYDAACGGERIAQAHRVTPPVACYIRRDESGVYTGTRDCRVDDYCFTSAECTAQPGGVCNGRASSQCEYAGVEAGAACERDADCSALPSGACVTLIEGGGQLCYPTGECRTTPTQGCTYSALGQPCASDADCSAAPGGSCRHTVSHSECAYNECDVNADCGLAARCECLGVRQCIPAACFSDADCAAGHRCEPTLALLCGNLNPPASYRCHTDADECQSEADCEGESCVFVPELSHWACRNVSCVTR